MQLTTLDVTVVALYVLFAVSVGLTFTRRASRGMEEYFLSGRSLPWWIAGTSMVATTFAADTPLVITGWVREHGIWKNWLWWCYAAGGVLTVFLFARYWRRGKVLTTAGLAELRYGGSGARVLRGFLGVYHAGVTNTIVLCWVMLAAAKIMDVLFGVDKFTALAIACGLSLSYSLLAGFWGVVLTDLVQFTMAMTGSICLAVLSWEAIGGTGGLMAAAGSAPFQADTLRFFPKPGEGSFFDASFWSAPVATIAVYLGVAWWAVESIDGGGPVVQRISATRNEREGTKAVLWFNLAHFALRPWPWIAVGLASLIILPPLVVEAPFAGVVGEVSATHIELQAEGGAATQLALYDESQEDDSWRALAEVQTGDNVESGQLLARTDGERAYVAMMTRFLPAGLLGLVVASLLAAFMSTIDTHVNLAASFFVSDVYRRFLARDKSERHYVKAARWTSASVLVLAAFLASQADSISDLFQFFLAFLGGVGPIYILRWLWWRVRASTEIAAMLASSLVTVALSQPALREGWADTPWSPGGVLSAEGRLLFVAGLSLTAALGSMLITKRPDPADLVSFYRRVRPLGAWGPVRALCPDVARPREGRHVVIGLVGSLALIYGMMLGTGYWLLEQQPASGIAYAVAFFGGFLVMRTLPRLFDKNHED